MVNCPNCGAELAPSVLSCANCRMPIATGPAQSGHQQDYTVIRPPVTQPGQSMQPNQPNQPSSQQASSFAAYGDYDYPDFSGESARSRRQRRNTITLLVLCGIVLAIALTAGSVVLTSLNSDAPDTASSAIPQVPRTPPAHPTPASPSGAERTGPAASTAPATSTGSGTESVTAATTAASSASPSQSSTSPQRGPTTTDADAHACTGQISVPASGTTSCEFARAVADAVARAGNGAEFEVEAHSPVTGRNYRMSCLRNDVLTTCTGGNNAVVWIYNGG